MHFRQPHHHQEPEQRCEPSAQIEHLLFSCEFSYVGFTTLHSLLPAFSRLPTMYSAGGKTAIRPATEMLMKRLGPRDGVLAREKGWQQVDTSTRLSVFGRHVNYF